MPPLGLASCGITERAIFAPLTTLAILVAKVLSFCWPWTLEALPFFELFCPPSWPLLPATLLPEAPAAPGLPKEPSEDVLPDDALPP